MISYEDYLNNINVGANNICPFCDEPTMCRLACNICWAEHDISAHRERKVNVWMGEGKSIPEVDEALCRYIYDIAHEFQVNRAIEKELLGVI